MQIRLSGTTKYCALYAVAGNLESLFSLASGTFQPLSYQYLLDCYDAEKGAFPQIIMR